MGPQASKMSPRASKITQNHENLVTQNQENPRKKTSRNGTVAGYARSALDKLDAWTLDTMDLGPWDPGP